MMAEMAAEYGEPAVMQEPSAEPPKKSSSKTKQTEEGSKQTNLFDF